MLSSTEVQDIGFVGYTGFEGSGSGGEDARLPGSVLAENEELG